MNETQSHDIDPTSLSLADLRALLGDRVRIVHDSDDNGVFVRSMATRGSLGGLSAKAKDAADQQEAMATLSQQSSRENAGTTSLGALLRAKLDNNNS